MIDGVTSPANDKITSPVFSADGKHSAYAGGKGAKEFVVLDGKEGPAFNAIGDNTTIFSPDSQRLAYGVHHDNGNVVHGRGRPDGPGIMTAAAYRYSALTANG